MDLEEHARLLGRVVGNLHSLEYLLRQYLYNHASPPHAPFPVGQTLTTLSVGEKVVVNALTDYSTLGQLISRYNALLPSSQSQLAVDRSITKLRDAIAHGRVWTPDPTVPLMLLKFERPDKPAKTLTTMSFRETLSQAWLREQATRIWAEIEKVGQAVGAQSVQLPT